MFTSLFSMLKCGILSVIERVQQVVKRRLRPHSHSLVIGAASVSVCSKGDLMLENALLRQPLSVVGWQVKRPQFRSLDRLAPSG